MERDLSLIRQIALCLDAAGEPLAGREIEVDGWDIEQILDQCEVMEAEYLLEVVAVSDPELSAHTRRWILAPDGQDFVDAVRDEGLWDRVRGFVSRVGTLSIQQLTQLAQIGYFTRQEEENHVLGEVGETRDGCQCCRRCGAVFFVSPERLVEECLGLPPRMRRNVLNQIRARPQEPFPVGPVHSKGDDVLPEHDESLPHCVQRM